MVKITSLIKAQELENRTNQAAQEMYSGEARKKSREAHAPENFPDHDNGPTAVQQQLIVLVVPFCILTMKWLWNSIVCPSPGLCHGPDHQS